MHEFDSKDIKRLLGISVSQIRSLVRAGHLRPLKTAGRLKYSFQDLIVLRTAGSLRAAKIPAQRINRALREIRDSLPGELPLSGLSIVAVGDRILVREGQTLRDGGTGQYTLALEVSDRSGELRLIDKREPALPPELGADTQFERALELEDTDRPAARAAYQACLAADAHHLEARLNLGRLLHLEGRLDEAEAVYRASRSSEAILSFNLAVLLEDFERPDEAVSEYRRALGLDPGFADAHFNLARLHERAGQPKEALRHMLAYRRLMNDA